MGIPANTKMIVYIDIEGKVIDVTYPDGKPAGNDAPYLKKPVSSVKKLDGHAVFAYETNPQRCVTYQTPSGPRTV
jgi:hypothetical protein